MMFTKEFWQAVLERAVKTFAQAFGAALVATGAASAWVIDWGLVSGTAGLATILSVLTSIGSGAITNEPGPSLTGAEVLSPPKD